MAQIDVLMPVYNGAKFLRPALESLLYQTFTDWRLILINDGSTDNTIDMVQELIPKCKLKLISSETRRGIVESLNDGIAHIDSRFVARFDADDINYQDRFERQMEYFSYYPQINAISTPITGINKEGKTRRIHSWKNLNAREVDALLPITNIVNHPTSFFRSKNFVNLRYKSKPAEDYYMWLENSHQLRWNILDAPYVKWRKHDRNISNKKYVFDEDFLSLRRINLARLEIDISRHVLLILNGNLTITSGEDVREISQLRNQMTKISSNESFISQLKIAFDTILISSIFPATPTLKIQIANLLTKHSYFRLTNTLISRILKC